MVIINLYIAMDNLIGTITGAEIILVTIRPLFFKSFFKVQVIRK